MAYARISRSRTVRCHLEKTIVGQKIKELSYDPQDRFLFEFAKTADVQKALIGAKVVSTGRKGKYFWLKFDREHWPIFHLGMSGNIFLLHAKFKALHEKSG